MKAPGRSESGIGAIEILNDPVGPDFESSRLPVVTMKHLNSSCSIFGCGKENGAVASRSVVWSQRDISPEDGSGLAKKIFKILPANSIRQL